MKKYFICLYLTMSFCSSTLFTQELPNNQVEEPSTVIPKPQEAPTIPPPSSTNSEYAFPLEDILPPKIEQTDRFFYEFLNMLAMLGLILGLILVMAWVLKKVMNTRIQQINTTSPIKVLESRTLTPKTGIYLLEIQGKGIAIAESHNGITLLAEFPDLSESASSSMDSPSAFDKILEEKTRNRER